MSEQHISEDYKRFEELLKQGAKEEDFLELYKKIVRGHSQMLFDKPKYSTISTEYSCYIVTLRIFEDESIILKICPQGSEMMISKDEHTYEKKSISKK